MSRRPKSDLNLDGEPPVTKDAMHMHQRISETDEGPITDEDLENFYQLVQQAKTKKGASTYNDPRGGEDLDEVLQLFDQPISERHSGRDDLLESLRKTVSSQLETSGFPDPFSLVITNGDDWRVLPDDWQGVSKDERTGLLKENEGLDIGFAYSQRVVAPLSDPYFAAEIASRIMVVETLSSRDHQDALLRIGFMAGQWNSRRHLSNVTRGKTVKAGASDGGKARGRALAPAKHKRLAEMQRLISSGKSERRAAEIAASRGFGPSTSANRKMWARAKNPSRDVE